MLALCAPGIAIALSPSLPASLSAEYSHRIWRVQDGLPQNRIQAISQTPDGYLWIGTSGGLVRFDGVRFFLFDRSNTPAFRDDSILALCPSRDGSLWVGTEGGALLHYRNGAFEAFGNDQGLTNGFVRALYEDPQANLWIGTDRGFFRLHDRRIDRLDGHNGTPITSITNIVSDSSGRIWAAGGPGLLVVENGVLRRFERENDVMRATRGVHPMRDGSLWLLTTSGLRRLANDAVTRNRALDPFTPVTLREDHEGNLWIGTLGQGLVRVGRSGVTAFCNAEGLPDNTVMAIFEDREQNLWIGTVDGLLRLSKNGIHTLTRREGLPDDNVSTIYEGPDHALWLVTVTGQVSRYTAAGFQSYHLPPAAADKRIRLVYQDRKGVLWFGSSNTGLVRVDGKKATSFSSADGLRNNQIRAFHEDRRGDLWVGLGSGVSRWDGTRFHNYYLEDGLVYGSVRVVTEDHNGDVLVGTDGGLNRIHDRQFVRDPQFAQLNGERIWAIHEDADGALWIGTRGGGLFRIKNGKVSRITVRDGLRSNSIYQVVEDPNGNLWMSSPAGVFSAPRAELNRVSDGHPGPIAVLPYGTADGLESTQMNGGIGSAGCVTAAGDVWFPSVKGAVRINPGQLRVTHPSPVLIESMTVDDRPLPLSSVIRIPAGPGKLEIDYTASSLLSPERISFRYRLEGYDPDWTNASTHRAAYYTNLPPGQYHFHVVATDSATPRETSEAVTAFVWEPHFHQTAWFYCLCATLAAFCGWAALRFYARQTKARYAMLLAERTRLAREMHDTVIQGCIGVSTLLEAASSFYDTSAGRTKDLLDQARVQVRLTLDEARQAVWDLRHTRLEGDIAVTLRDFAQQLSAEKGIPIDVELEGAPPHLEERTLWTLLLVAREAIRNAVMHALPRQIRIRMSFESNQVRLDVVDDGCGFAPARGFETGNGHYGIVGMKERVEQLGGSFLLSSSPGCGTVVTARLPLTGNRQKSEPVPSR